MSFDKLLKLKADSPQNIVEKLYEQVKNERGNAKPQLPHLNLSLSGGSRLNGFLLHYNRNSGEILLGILHEGLPEVKYCSSASVVSVEILNTTPFMYALSDGDIAFTPSEADVPSSLELKRLLADTNSKLSETLEKEISVVFDLTSVNEPMLLYTAKLLIKMVKDVFMKIAESDLGNSALKENIETVELQLGEANEVILHDHVLKIGCKIQNSPALAWSHADLQEKIEEKL